MTIGLESSRLPRHFHRFRSISILRARTGNPLAGAKRAAPEPFERDRTHATGSVSKLQSCLVAGNRRPPPRASLAAAFQHKPAGLVEERVFPGARQTYISTFLNNHPSGTRHRPSGKPPSRLQAAKNTRSSDHPPAVHGSHFVESNLAHRPPQPWTVSAACHSVIGAGRGTCIDRSRSAVHDHFGYRRLASMIASGHRLLVSSVIESLALEPDAERTLIRRDRQIRFSPPCCPAKERRHEHVPRRALASARVDPLTVGRAQAFGARLEADDVRSPARSCGRPRRLLPRDQSAAWAFSPKGRLVSPHHAPRRQQPPPC